MANTKDVMAELWRDLEMGKPMAQKFNHYRDMGIHVSTEKFDIPPYPKASSYPRCTLLSAAVERQLDTAVEFLLNLKDSDSFGFDVNDWDRQGPDSANGPFISPLGRAVLQHAPADETDDSPRRKIIRLLLKHGAKVDQTKSHVFSAYTNYVWQNQTAYTESVLVQAVKSYPNIHVIKILLDGGGSPTARITGEHKSALETAQIHQPNHKALLKLLEDYKDGKPPTKPDSTKPDPAKPDPPKPHQPQPGDGGSTGNNNSDTTLPPPTPNRPSQQEISSAIDSLRNHVEYERDAVQPFYPTILTNDASARPFAQAAAKLIEYVMALVPDPIDRENVNNAGALALYDLLVLVDDSPSMKTEDPKDGRLKTLRAVLKHIVRIYSMVSPNFGVYNISWVNSTETLEQPGILETDIDGFIDDNEFKRGHSSIGTVLQKKILNEYLYKHHPARNPRRPMLILIITDGETSVEPPNTLEKKIRASLEAVQQNASSIPQGPAYILYQFLRVGGSSEAKKLLARIITPLDFTEKVYSQPDSISLDDAVKQGERQAFLTVLKLLLTPITPMWADIKTT